MSVSGVFTTNVADYTTQSVQNARQQIQQDSEQLGQDLQSGNLSAAQSDFATLEKLLPQNTSTSATENDPVAQAFNQLSADLQSGNLSAAQQAYANIQQDFQSQGARTEGHHHHPHQQGDGGTGNFSQLLSQLGQALRSGNLSQAQQVFASLQQDFEQWGQGQEQSQPSQSQSSSTGSSGTAS
jgi:outer membrane protein assembly factor BamD (BamD/ComL family)